MKVTWDSPGRENETIFSYSPVSISFFSMRSVTWRETSSALAPGQLVLITMALKVNGGSSLWPSLVYESVPTRASSTIRNSTIWRLRSAQAERLKPIGTYSLAARFTTRLDRSTGRICCPSCSTWPPAATTQSVGLRPSSTGTLAWP